MNEEIKEILDYLKNNKYIPDENKIQHKILCRDDIRYLLDYITNLQEKEKLFESIVYKYDELKEENERLKEKINHLLIDLNGESEYKSRNEKVITYIDSLFNTIDYKDEEFITFETLQNIQNLAKYGSLNGGDEE